MPRFIVACASLLFSMATMANPVEVSFQATDGISVYGDIYPSSGGKSDPIILLFHQAGGNARGEYTGIAQRLVESGYNVLAIDQRSGGSRFGAINRTVQALDNETYDYCEVYPDLEAALRFARGEGFVGRLAVWGSSYSAALVFKLGANEGEKIDAVLAFSPASGAPLANCDPQQFLGDLSTPALALRPQREFDIDSVKEQMRRFENAGVRTYVADPGVHGSSMLVTDRVEGETERTWTVVLDFLEETLRRN